MVVACVCMCCHVAQAEEPDYFHLSPESLLNAEVVSVSRKSQKLSKSAAAVFVVTQEDIRRSGLQSLPEVLRMVPGVQVARADSNSWAISIRGFNGVLNNNLLVMIDGRSVYNPLFAGTYWELQDVMLEDVERIEVVRGPGGSQWGANAVNGVINILTKNAEETQGNLATVIVGSESVQAAARHGGAVGDDGYYRAYAKAFRYGSSRAPGGGSQHDEWDGFRTGFRYDREGGMTVEGDAYRILTNQMVSIPQIAGPPYALVQPETMDSHGANILGRWSDACRSWEGSCSVQTWLDYTEREQTILHDKRIIFDTEFQRNFPVSGRHEATAGGGWRLTHDDLGGAQSVTFTPASRTDNLFSAFAQDRITLVPDEWYFTLGVKVEHNDYTGFEIQPDARLQWQPDDSRTAWASVSRAVRTPSRLEHDLTQLLLVTSAAGALGPAGTQVVLQANPDFDSEKLVAYEAGYRQQVTAGFTVDGALFFHDYDDLTVAGFLPPGGGVFPINASNNMTGETYGFEMAATWAAADNLKLVATYSYLDMFLHAGANNGFNLETAEGQSPQNQASLRSMWNVTDRLSLDTSLYYVGALPQYNVDSYVRADVNLGWQAADNLRLNLTGQNLLDSAQREFSSATSLNAAEVERSIFGKVTWQF